jgi:ATP-dependent helicase/DNAse subunit B
MGVVVRAAEVYVPLLRATLERFGIPARFYFDSPMERHPAVRYLAGAVEAMLGGWDHSATLAVLRLAPRFADFNALDALDFKARERIPAAGLDALKALTQSEAIHHRLDALGGLEELRPLLLAPRDWAIRLRTLRDLFRPGLEEPPWHDLALLYRSQAAALDAFDEALEEAAAALDAAAMPLVEFWRAVRGVLRIKPLRLADGRRNVVHVLSAPEARQWVLPVVFVCGMVEKQFPKFHPQDPFFPDGARARLNAAGIRVRTAAQLEREERALFDTAVSRATLLTVLSYPEFDARGERNLPSLYLDSFAVPHGAARPVRPLPRHAAPAAPPARIAAPALLDWLRERTAQVSPTALEAFLQCPFQYFGTRLLRLQTAPPRPEERLDFPAQGDVVHALLAAWWREGGDIAARFDAVFADYAQKKAIPIHSYQTERLRNAMLDDLRRFAADARWPRNGNSSLTEEKFSFELAPGLAVIGKIDRLDKTPQGAYVIDYKYSNSQRTKDRLKDESLLQAPLYLMAAEKHFQLHPEGVFYVGVKGEILYVGWSESGIFDSLPIETGWLPRTAERTLAIVKEIRSGRIEPAPKDSAKCKWCDARDVCRVEGAQAEAPEALAEGA